MNKPVHGKHSSPENVTMAMIVQAMRSRGHKIRCIQAATGRYRQTITLHLYNVPSRYKRMWWQRSPAEQGAALKVVDEEYEPQCTCKIPVAQVRNPMEYRGYDATYTISGPIRWKRVNYRRHHAHHYKRVVEDDGTVKVVACGGCGDPV